MTARDPLVARIDVLRLRGVSMETIARAAGTTRGTLAAWVETRRTRPQRRSLSERVHDALMVLEEAHGDMRPTAVPRTIRRG